jgi:hypothetical protein
LTDLIGFRPDHIGNGVRLCGFPFARATEMCQNLTSIIGLDLRSDAQSAFFQNSSQVGE